MQLRLKPQKPSLIVSQHSFFDLIDVKGSAHKETIIIDKIKDGRYSIALSTKSHIAPIFYLNFGFYDTDLLNQTPSPIEMYLTARKSFKQYKAFRLTIHEIDSAPNFFFIDLYYTRKKWFIDGFTILNTHTEIKKYYICHKTVNKTVQEALFTVDTSFDKSTIMYEYFNNKMWECK